MLEVTLLSLLCLCKNVVAFKIIIDQMNFDQVMILKATTFLEGHKRYKNNKIVTSKITEVRGHCWTFYFV